MMVIFCKGVMLGGNVVQILNLILHNYFILCTYRKLTQITPMHALQCVRTPQEFSPGGLICGNAQLVYMACKKGFSIYAVADKNDKIVSRI